MKDKSKEVELVADAWPRFERFIKQIAKAGPQHKTSSAPHSEMKVGKKAAKRAKVAKKRR
jgi:hypothetical protein